MKNHDLVRAVLLGSSLYCAAALAADPGLDVKAKLATQKLDVHVAVNDPPTVTVQASGPVLNANINVRSQSGQCLLLVTEIAPGVCVPVGREPPVSPN